MGTGRRYSTLVSAVLRTPSFQDWSFSVGLATKALGKCGGISVGQKHVGRRWVALGTSIVIRISNRAKCNAAVGRVREDVGRRGAQVVLKQKINVNQWCASTCAACSMHRDERWVTIQSMTQVFRFTSIV